MDERSEPHNSKLMRIFLCLYISRVDREVRMCRRGVAERAHSAFALPWYTDQVHLSHVMFSIAVPADAPNNLTISLINATSVFLSWSPPLTPYGNIVSYTIQIEDEDGNVTVVIVSSISATLADLPPYSDLRFNVSAATRIGNGPYVTITISTPEDSE